MVRPAFNTVSQPFARPGLEPVQEQHDDDFARIESLLQHRISGYVGSFGAQQAEYDSGVDALLPAVSAARLIAPYIVPTSLVYAANLSAELGNAIWIKPEYLQPTRAYKLRGAANRMVRLSAEDRALGVVAKSAGNHGLAVAYMARQLGIPATIITPKNASDAKVQPMRDLGAEVLQYGSNYSEAASWAEPFIAESGMVDIHPFADEFVANGGGGTIALEIMQELPTLNRLVLPVGGGGLFYGAERVVRALSDTAEVDIAQYDQSDAMIQSLAAGELITLATVGNLVDGTAVRRVSELTLSAARRANHFHRVSESQIILAVSDIYRDTGRHVETAGALGIAAIRQLVEQTGVTGQTFVTVATGGNNSERRLRFMVEGADFLRGKQALLSIQIPERAGSFRQLVHSLGAHNVTKFRYSRSESEAATILLGIDLKDAADKQQVLDDLNAQDYTYRDLSSNRLARQHAEHLVGGPSTLPPEQEVSFQIEFPEKAGALGHFLDVLNDRWDVSRFDYENTGSDTGDVLISFRVGDEADSQALQQVLTETGYSITPVIAADLQ